jgi:hypothetical protein
MGTAVIAAESFKAIHSRMPLRPEANRVFYRPVAWETANQLFYESM